MSDAGWELRKIRERLNLTYRDVADATNQIAHAKANPEFYLPISRLSEIENHNVVPSFYRIYSLCVVYRTNFLDVLRWYGVDLRNYGEDARQFSMSKTHLIGDIPDDHQRVDLPISLDPGFHPRHSAYLSRMIQQWGSLPLAMLRSLETLPFRYGYVGQDDWMMYPLIRPGALVQIDPKRKKVGAGGWSNEYERPIYFVETHDSYLCCWLQQLETGHYLLQPHTLSPCKATVKAMPQDALVVGQVTGVAMQLSSATTGTVPATLNLR